MEKTAMESRQTKKKTNYRTIQGSTLNVPSSPPQKRGASKEEWKETILEEDNNCKSGLLKAKGSDYF